MEFVKQMVSFLTFTLFDQEVQAQSAKPPVGSVFQSFLLLENLFLLDDKMYEI